MDLSLQFSPHHYDSEYPDRAKVGDKIGSLKARVIKASSVKPAGEGTRPLQVVMCEVQEGKYATWYYTMDNDACHDGSYFEVWGKTTKEDCYFDAHASYRARCKTYGVAA